LLLRNEESLEPEEAEKLQEVRDKFPELGTVVLMKEKLRNVYKLADDKVDAEISLEDWCSEAESSNIKELKSMAKTLRTHWAGVLAYWTTDGVTSAAVEGFNNKIRWLVKQAYGYHDKEYFRLKIFDLPNIKIQKEL